MLVLKSFFEKNNDPIPFRFLLEKMSKPFYSFILFIPVSEFSFGALHPSVSFRFLANPLGFASIMSLSLFKKKTFSPPRREMRLGFLFSISKRNGDILSIFLPSEVFRKTTFTVIERLLLHKITLYTPLAPTRRCYSRHHSTAKLLNNLTQKVRDGIT